jgi:hypothetical protein
VKGLVNLVKAQFTAENLAGSFIQTVLLSVLVRLVLLVFGVEPKLEWLFWVIVPALLLLTIQVFDRLLHPRQRRPKFDVFIEHMSFGSAGFELEGVTRRGAFIFLIASIRNQGAPSSLSAYRLTVEFPNGQVLKGERVGVFSEGLKINEVKQGRALSFEASDALDAKTLSPIVEGGLAQGFLLFSFPDIETQSVSAPEATVKLRMIDAWRGEHFGIRPIGALNTKPMPKFTGVSLRTSELVVDSVNKDEVH